MQFKDIKKNRGSLLLEVLVAIALFLAISTIIAQALFSSFYGGKQTQDKMAMNDLLSEQISKIRALSDEHWSNIGNLNRDTDYYIDKLNDNYIVASGTYSGIANGLNYKISFKVSDIARDISSTNTDMMLDSTSTGVKDSGSLLITSIGLFNNNSDPVVIKTILTRWRNIICSQSNWSATGSVTSIPCETSNINYSSKTNIEAGAQLKLCNGCI